MKKILFVLCCFIATTNVYAASAMHVFEEVFISYLDESNTLITSPLNKLINSSTGDYLFKLYIADVTVYNYESYENDFLKDSQVNEVNSIVGHMYELIDSTNNYDYYYIAQKEIYSYFYSDYDIYFSDSEGNYNDYYNSLNEEFTTYRNQTINNITSLYIYNNQKVQLTYTSVSKLSNLTTTCEDNSITMLITSGDSSQIKVTNLFNEDGTNTYYINSDNYILLDGLGEYYETETIDIYLENATTVDTDNPPTGNEPFALLYIGVPIILAGTLIALLINKYKRNK